MKEACPISKCGKVHGMCPHTLLGQLSPTYKFELAVGLDGGAYRCMLWDVLKTLLTEECKCIADEADTEIKCTCNPANVIPSKKHFDLDTNFWEQLEGEALTGTFNVTHYMDQRTGEMKESLLLVAADFYKAPMDTAAASSASSSSSSSGSGKAKA